MHAQLTTGTILTGRFQLGREISQDAAGSFWDAIECSTGERATVRGIIPEIALGRHEVDDLRASLEQLSDWEETSAVVPHTLIAEGKNLFAISEPVFGRSLAALRLEQPARWLAIAEMESIALQIAAIMNAAHARQLVHGGLRPGNIFVDDSGRVTIADFGTGRAISASVIRNRPTSARAAMEPYMSRTLLKGQGPYLTDDIYAFGAIVYEALTGTIPLQAEKRHFWSKKSVPNTPALMTERRKLSPHWNQAETIPSSWEQLILACLDRDGFARPQRFGKIISQIPRISPELRSSRKSTPAPGHRTAPASLPTAAAASASATSSTRTRKVSEAHPERKHRDLVETSRPAAAVTSQAKPAPPQPPRTNPNRWNDALTAEFWGGDPLASPKRPSSDAARPQAPHPRATAARPPVSSPKSGGAAKFLVRALVVVLTLGLFGAAAYFASLERARRLEQDSTPDTASKEATGAPVAEAPEPVAVAAEAPAAATARPTGRLAVRTIPIGASVKVGERASETGPVLIDEMPVGSHQVTVSAAGFSPKEMEVEIAARQLASIDVALERSTGIASITSSAPGLEFTISSSTDGRTLLSGITPRELSLPTGDYEVVFTPPQGENIRRKLTVNENGFASVAVAHSPPPAKIEPSAQAADSIEEAISPAAEKPAVEAPTPVERAPVARDTSPGERPVPPQQDAMTADAETPAQPEPVGRAVKDSRPAEPDPEVPPPVRDSIVPPPMPPAKPAAVEPDTQPSADSEPDPTEKPAIESGSNAHIAAGPVPEAEPAPESAAPTPPASGNAPAADQVGESVTASSTTAESPPRPAQGKEHAGRSEGDNVETRTKISDEEPTPTDVAVRLFPLAEVDTMPQLLEREEPKMPRRFRRKDGVGTVGIEVIIDREGFISSARVLESTDDRLSQACIEAIQLWRFSPARKDGQRVAVRTTLPFVFK